MPQAGNTQRNQPAEKGWFGNLLDNIGAIFAAIGALIAGIFGFKTGGKDNTSHRASGAGGASHRRYAPDGRGAHDEGTHAYENTRRQYRDRSSGRDDAQQPREPLNYVDLSSDNYRDQTKEILARHALFRDERDGYYSKRSNLLDQAQSALNGNGDSRLQGEEFRGVRFREANQYWSQAENLRLTPYKNPQPHPDETFQMQLAMSTKAAGATILDPAITREEIFKRLNDGSVQVRTFGGDYRIDKLPESVNGVTYRVTVYDAKLPSVDDILDGKKITQRFEPASVILTEDELRRMTTNDRYLQESTDRSLTKSPNARYAYSDVGSNDVISPGVSFSNPAGQSRTPTA
ncbi:MAG: hypothetical protein SFW63_03140 [Alphaproteobacteria bacterium]|nr:hypothetical protein [Alphaproteobacteria bacterium]